MGKSFPFNLKPVFTHFRPDFTSFQPNHSWQRVPNPLFYEDPFILPTTTPFSNLLQLLLPRCLQPLSPMLFLLFYVFGWMGDSATFDVPLNDIMDLHMSNFGTSEGPCCVFYATRRQGLLRSDTWGILLVLWFDITQIQNHTAHSGANRLTHSYKYILTPPVMCSQQLSALHWIIHWYQKFSYHNVFSFQKLLTCRSHISVD